MTKKCSRCREKKDTSSFTINRLTKDGFQAWCKDCTRDYQRERAKQRAEIPKKVAIKLHFGEGRKAQERLSLIEEEAWKRGISKSRMALVLIQEALDARFWKEVNARDNTGHQEGDSGSAEADPEIC